MDFKQIHDKALDIREKYLQLEKKRGHEWSRSEIMMGFVGDVGDLAKLSMAKDGIRPLVNVDDKFAHELIDCFWSILVLADKYNVDLENEFVAKMDELEKNIDLELSNK